MEFLCYLPKGTLYQVIATFEDPAFGVIVGYQDILTGAIYFRVATDFAQFSPPETRPQPYFTPAQSEYRVKVKQAGQWLDAIWPEGEASIHLCCAGE